MAGRSARGRVALIPSVGTSPSKAAHLTVWPDRSLHINMEAISRPSLAAPSTMDGPSPNWTAAISLAIGDAARDISLWHVLAGSVGEYGTLQKFKSIFRGINTIWGN